MYEKSVCSSLKTLLSASPASIALFLIAPDFHYGIHEFSMAKLPSDFELSGKRGSQFCIHLEVLRQRMEWGNG